MTWCRTRAVLLVLPLLLAALWLRALPAAGWMPVVHNGGIVMAMCGGTGTVDTGDGVPHGDQPCAFAAMAALAGDPPPVAALPATVVIAVAAGIPGLFFRLPPPRHSRPPSQGPPPLRLA